MHGTETRLRAQREMFYFDTIALTLFCKDFDARQMSVGVLSLKPVEDGELLSNLPPTVRLDAQAAQVLMDDLWAAGLRPTEEGGAGALGATERHLADLKQILWNRLGLPAGTQPKGQP